MTRHICRFVGHDWAFLFAASGRSWFRCRRCRAIDAEVAPAA
jgi:hypothetical protein